MSLGDPLQSARDFLRSIPELVGVGKPLADALQITAKRIEAEDVDGGRRVVRLAPFGGFGQRGPVHHHVRLMVRCYGASDPDAADLFELVRSLLAPDPKLRTVGWENDAAQIVDVSEDGWINRDIDEDFNAPYVQATFGLLVKKRLRTLP